MDDCIPANPDISGVGVRIAIYVQNILSFIPALWALRDGRISVDELKVVEKQSISILITAFAVLISAFAQAATFGLSAFHASIVLSLSWMNNTNIFIYFVLYFHHMIDRHRKPAPATQRPTPWSTIMLRTCREHIWAVLARAPDTPIRNLGFQVLFDPFSLLTPERSLGSWTLIPHLLSNLRKYYKRNLRAEHVPSPQSNPIHVIGWWFVVMFSMRRKLVFLLGLLHLTLMAILGMWVWSSPLHFEEVQQRRLALHGASLGISDLLPIHCTHITILGTSIDMTSKAFADVSMFVYALFLSGWGFVIPLLFLGILFLRFGWLSSPFRLRTSHTDNTATDPERDPVVMRSSSYRRVDRLFEPRNSGIMQSFGLNMHRSGISILPVTLGLVLVLMVNIVFMVDIELTISRAKRFQAQDEANWTFGQTLALLLLVLPIRDVVETIGETLKVELIEKCTETLRLAIDKDEPDLASARREARWAANVGVYINDRFPSALQCAAFFGDLELVRILLDNNADINAADRDGTHGSPLMAAVSRGHAEVAAYLVKQPKIKWGRSNQDGKTVLHFAAEHGLATIVEYLLDRGTNPNVLTNNGSSPLHLAIAHSVVDQPNSFKVYVQVVKLLLSRGSLINEADHDGCTPLTFAVRNRQQAMVRMLLKHKADISADGPRCCKLLRDAADEGDVSMIRFLVECDADPSLSDEHGRTLFLNVTKAGNEGIVRLLLRHGGGVDQLGQAANNGWTALMHATHEGHESMVRLLLEHKANFDLVNEGGDTALSIAQKEGHVKVADLLLEWAKMTSTETQSTGVSQQLLEQTSQQSGETPMNEQREG